jgi:tetratricopeptide (TPR) repeat protein
MSRVEAIKYYKIGRSLSQGSKESQYYFDLAIESDPTFSYAYFEKSVPFNKRGDYAKGFELLNKAVDLNPRMHLGYRGWLRLVKLKDYGGCITDLLQLQKIKSKNSVKAWGQNINFLIGLSHSGLEKYDEAIEYFDIAINEKNGELHLNNYLYKAIALIEVGEFEQSIKNLDLCIKNDEVFTEAYYYLGLNYSRLNQKIRAKNHFDKALSLFKRGFKMRNPYNEVFLELYLSDIEHQLFKNKPS